MTHKAKQLKLRLYSMDLMTSINEVQLFFVCFTYAYSFIKCVVYNGIFCHCVEVENLGQILCVNTIYTINTQQHQSSTSTFYIAIINMFPPFYGNARHTPYQLTLNYITLSINLCAHFYYSVVQNIFIHFTFTCLFMMLQKSINTNGQRGL